MDCKFFNKETSSGTVKNEIISNKKLAEVLCKPIIRKVHSSFIENT